MIIDDNRWHVEQADCVEWLTTRSSGSIDLIIGSPPYPEKGERYIGGRKKWPTMEWVEWMINVTVAATRASRSMVLWVANGAVRKGVYLPACEGLI
jgi:hypothetical protein